VNVSQKNKFAIDDIVAVLPNPNYFNDNDGPPCTFTEPDSYSYSSEGSITIDACDVLDNKDIQVELDYKGSLLTIRVIYPNRNKENFSLDLLF
jgi:hypothetical protein